MSLLPEIWQLDCRPLWMTCLPCSLLTNSETRRVLTYRVPSIDYLRVQLVCLNPSPFLWVPSRCTSGTSSTTPELSWPPELDPEYWMGVWSTRLSLRDDLPQRFLVGCSFLTGESCIFFHLDEYRGTFSERSVSIVDRQCVFSRTFTTPTTVQYFSF